MADIEGMRRVLIETLHKIELTESEERRPVVMENMVTMLDEVHVVAIARLAVMILQSAKEASDDRRVELMESVRNLISTKDTEFAMNLRSAVHSFAKESGLPNPFNT